MTVEDRAEFRRLLTMMLNRQADFEVVAEAKSLQAARYHAAREVLDVVLLDLNLPDGKGWYLIADLRGANPHVAVIVLSASFDGANLARANEAGADAIADAILDKFASPSEVVAAVRNAFASRGPRFSHLRSARSIS
jgi:DNA-binding NarL/FixJ family response regulator